MLLLLLLLFNILFRWMISLNSYSGYNNPPMFGDYEAQRHWMEITFNLPIKEWYLNTTSNDLLYWGLDYPPLTAYHSYVMGKIVNIIKPQWNLLYISRGLTDPYHKLFMRSTVLISDLFIFFSAIWFYWKKCSFQSQWKMYMLLTLLYPGLVLIDHGHFQYNCVSLGLFVWCIAMISQKSYVTSAIYFVLALNYKQMELYHALPIFAYLLGQCFYKPSESLNDYNGDRKRGINLLLFMRISIATIVTFIVCWYPFIWQKDVFYAVLQRLFPFNRGLYEDKVSNFWCSLSPFIKFKAIFDQQTLIYLSSGLTLCGSLPSFLLCLNKPQTHTLKLALINVSLSFFLFSFQVHEKSILLVAIPMLLLLPDYPFASINFLMISGLSMYSLFVKDGLVIPYYATFVMYFLLFCQELIINPICSTFKIPTKINMYRISMIASLVLSVSFHWIKIGDRYHLPDLMTLLICQFCFIHFFFYLLYFNTQILFMNNTLNGKFGRCISPVKQSKLNTEIINNPTVAQIKKVF